jgi:glycosyltransferase involved in cell wall biosynthesis
MKTPLVSIIVPCFNYARYLPDCVGSILSQQDVADFEVLLIDDASTDDTVDVMRSINDPRVRLMFNEKNLGHVGTITRGLRAARGQFVARIDPDDRYRADFLTATLEQFEKHPEVGLVYGDVSQIDDTGRITQARSDCAHGGRDFKGNELVALLKRNFVCAPSVIARREGWIDALPVPAHLAFNDWYFTLMMARRWEFYYIDRVIADYRVHAANHHTKISQDKSEETSILWLLDKFYTETEPLPAMELDKRSARPAVYAAHYLDIGDKYFGFRMYADARRCYLAALMLRPTDAWTVGIARRFLGTIIGERLYEMVKGAARRTLHPGRAALRNP